MDPVTGMAVLSSGSKLFSSGTKAITSAFHDNTNDTEDEAASEVSDERWKAITNPNSGASKSYYLGGSPDFAREYAENAKGAAEKIQKMAPVRADLSKDHALAGQQMQLLGQMRDRYMGNAPSVAQMQNAAALGANQRASLAGLSANPRNLAAQRAAIMSGAANAGNIASTGAGQRSAETFGVSNQAAGLSTNMADASVRNGLRQAALDLEWRAAQDGFANQYYGLANDALNAQAVAGRARGNAIIDAGKMRTKRVQDRAEQIAKNNNSETDALGTAIGTLFGGFGFLGL